jgi:hypothetical protein
MKKIILLLLVVAVFSACEQDTMTNTPALQGKLENVFWRAIDSKAVLNQDGSLTITGLARLQTLVLQTSSKNKGTYVLGNSNSRFATFEQEYEDVVLTYQTGKDIGGNGQIVITEFDSENGTVSGNFRFNAINDENNPLGGEIINFNQGVFYKVPVIGLSD